MEGESIPAPERKTAFRLCAGQHTTRYHDTGEYSTHRTEDEERARSQVRSSALSSYVEGESIPAPEQRRETLLDLTVRRACAG